MKLDQLKNTIFEVKQDHWTENGQEAKFRFVSFKKKDLTKQLSVTANDKQRSKTLLQIVDMTHEKLYGKAKIEKKLFELINAAVSHELRNPLSSMIAQVHKIEEIQQLFSEVIQGLDEESNQFVEPLQKILSHFYTGTDKMTSAVKFIDFFVHDMLDYTLLSNASNKLMKDIMMFDIRVALAEIINMLEDKTKAKKIQILIEFKGFHNSHMVKTDSKRLQQVLLNLISNALKFTDVDGSIVI